MLCHRYTTTEELQVALDFLKNQGIEKQQLLITRETSDDCYYIMHNDEIAPHMPEPILFVPVTPTQEPTSEEPN